MIQPDPPPPAPAEKPAHTGRRVLANTGALTAGSLWRIGAAFLVQLLVARQLGAAALGAYAVTLAYLNVGQIVTEAGLPTLLVREVSGRPALRRAWHRRVLTLQLGLSLLVWALLVAGAALLAPQSEQAALLLIGGASLPLYALLAASGAVFEASERMEPILAAETLSNVVLVAGVITALWLGMGVAALLAVTVAAQATAALLALLLLLRGRFLAGPQEPAVLPIRPTLRRAAPFFGLAFLDTAQQRADLILLSLIAPPALIGLYAAANSIVRVGIKMVQAFWRALFPTLVRLDAQAAAALVQLDELALRALSALTLPAAAIGVVISTGLVTFLFGPAYAGAALPLALLVWTVPLYAWEQRAVALLLVVRRPHAGMWVALWQLIALLLLLPPLTLLWGASGAAAAGVGSGLAGALAGGWMLARAGRPLRMLLVLPAAGTAALAAAAAWLPQQWLVAAGLGLVVALLAGRLLHAYGPGDLALLRRSLRARPLHEAG